jgi:Peptidase family C25
MLRKRSAHKRPGIVLLFVALVSGLCLPAGGPLQSLLAPSVHADSTPQTLPFNLQLRHSQANPRSSPGRTATPGGGSAAQMATQAELAAGGAIKLTVTEEGWYRVTQPELRSAGLNPGVDPRKLQLFAEGEEQSILVRGEDDGRFDDADAIEFYGIGLDTPATNARVYWLAAGNQPGRRMAVGKARAKRNAPSGFDYTVERRDRTIYFSSLRNGEAENFFGAIIARDPLEQTLTLPRVDAASGDNGWLEVNLQGVNGTPHRVSVRFNGGPLGEVVFYSTEQGSARFTVPRAQIREGQNTVTLTATMGESDVSLVDSIHMTYRRAYVADNNALRFTLQSKQRAAIDGFTSPAVRVVDVSDPQAPREVRASVEPSGGGYRVTTGATGGQRMMLAFADDQVKRPASITMDAASVLKDKSQIADLVMIAPRNFFTALTPLVEWREDHDLNITLVDIEDVYDEFNFGERSPQAVKDFLAYAAANWAKAPRYVLLVGDASYDPKNYLGFGDWNLVPTKLVDTIAMETASDDWLADFDGDGLPELAVGRLPARAASEVSLMVSKIIDYDRSLPPQDVLFVSDSNDGIDFERGISELRRLVPGGKPVEEIVRGRLDDSTTRGQVIGSLNRAPRIVNYFGHGSVDLWRGNILTATDAPVLAGSGVPSVFFSITCLNGYFHDPTLESLAESLMHVEHGGAVAVWSSSSLCGADTQLEMDMEMFRQLFTSTGEPLTLGEATRRAKASTADQDIRASYIVFGDPTMRLR